MSCETCPISLLCLGQALRRTACNLCGNTIVSEAGPLTFNAYIFPPQHCPDFVPTSILTCPTCNAGRRDIVQRGGMWHDFKRKRHVGFLEMIRKQKPASV